MTAPLGNLAHLMIPRIKMLADPRKPDSKLIAKRLENLQVVRNPNLIVVVGGDGYMLQMVRKWHHLGLPFLGLSVGHVGYLMNDPHLFHHGFPQEALQTVDLPLLSVETTSTTGKVEHHLAFNDASTQQVSGQASHLHITINGELRKDHTGKPTNFMGDGILVATPQGSPAYASSMGMHPVPIDSNVLVLAASNSYSPPKFKGACLPMSSKIELAAVNADRRKVKGFVDGRDLGYIRKMTIEVDRQRTVRMCFCNEESLSQKLINLQFNGSLPHQ